MTDKKFRILSIDGGGIRGVFPAHILKCISERLNIETTTHFDMYVGTSTGAIIAAALACNIPPETIVKMYKERGSEIFKKKFSLWPAWIRPGVHSVYKKENLAEILKEIFKDIKLGDISKPLVIPSTDIGNGGVYVFKSGYSPSFTRDKNTFVRDAVLASCSAPTFFDPTLLNEYALVDGGLWANNPSLSAVIEAKRRLNVEMKNISILSLGTGFSKTFYDVNIYKRKWKIFRRRWGLVTGWKARTFIDFLMSLQAQSIQNHLELLLAKDQLCRVSFDSDCPLPLDDCSAVASLISKADKEFTYRSEAINSFLKN